MRGFLGCFISELCWPRSLPACSLHGSELSLARSLARRLCLDLHMFFLFPFTAPLPKKSPLRIDNDFPNLYVFAFPVTAFSSFTQSHRVMETQMQKLAQIKL